MTRKRNNQKKIWLSDDEKREAEELRENIILGLVWVPSDHELYNFGVKTYREKLEAIRRDIASRPQNDEAIKPAVPPAVLKVMREHAHDEADLPELSTYERKMAQIKGQRVRAEDEFGFKRYPVVTPERVDPLDNMYSAGDQAPPVGLLEFYTLSLASWQNLLESERLALKERYEFGLKYGNLR